MRLLRRMAKPDKSLSHNDIPAPFSALMEPPNADYRGLSTLECPCGGDFFILCAKYDPETRLPGLIILDGRCANCGAWVSLPTPLDEDFQ